MDADGIASTECPLPSEPIIISSNSSSSCPQSDLPPPSSTAYFNGNEQHESSSCNGDANFIQKEDFEIKYEKEEEEEGEDENAFPEHSNSGEQQQQQQLLPSFIESEYTTIATAAINNVLNVKAEAETGEPDSIQSSENNICHDEDDDYRINFAPTFRPMRRRLNPPPTLPLPLMSALKRPKQVEEEDPCRPSSSPSSSSSFEPSFDANLIVPTKRAHIAVTAATVPGWLLNRHLSRLDTFSKESGAALAKRRAQRKSLLQLQTAQQDEKGKSNSGHLPAAPVTKEDHLPGPSNGAATVAPYICRRCAHRFTSKETLKLHMSLHREMKWEDDDDGSENTAPSNTNCTTAATITTNGHELNDVEKVKSEPGAIITNGLPSPSDYIYDDDDLDYDDDDDYDDEDEDDDDNEDELLDERDPELDEMGQVKLKPFTCYLNDDDDDDSEEDEEEEEYEEEEDGVYGNHSTMNGGYQSDEDEDRQNFEQQQQPKVPPLPPPPTRPSAKRQKALQKKTSRYMSKKLEKLAALPQVLTGNQLPPTIDGKFVTVSLACPACKLSLPDKDQLDAHLLSVHQLHPFRCLLPGCEASFSTSDELTDHISTDHDSAGPYVCGLCTNTNNNTDKQNSSSAAAAQGATQPSYKLLAIHHLNYHQRGVFRCPVGGGCQATAPYRVLAIRHYHLVHLPYACTWKHCKRTFAYQPELEAHQAGHAAPRPFSCTAPDCGKTFLTKAHLAEHERIHTGVKPFLCTFLLCDYAAKTRNSVLVHVRSKHLGMTRMSAAEKAEAERRHDPQQYVAVRRELL